MCFFLRLAPLLRLRPARRLQDRPPPPREHPHSRPIFLRVGPPIYLYLPFSFPRFAASESFRRIKADSHRPGQFRFTSPPATSGGNFLCHRLCGPTLLL